MSTAPKYYFRDTKGAGADPNAKAGSDNNDGLSDKTAKQNYVTALSLVGSVPAGTEIFVANSCGFIQPSSFRFSSNNAVSIIDTIEFDGTHVICTIAKACNMTVGQNFNMKGSSQKAVNGLVTVAEISADTKTFKYLPNGTPTNPIAIDTNWHNAIRFDGGLITIKTYTSSEFVAQNRTPPLVEYNDSSHAQHRMDRGAFGCVKWKGISYVYKGALTGSPSCFFTYDEGKDSLTLEDLKIDGFRMAAYPNNKGRGTVNDFTMIGCEVVNNWYQGLMGNPDYSLISGNLFKNNGHNNSAGGTDKLHNVYLSEFHNTRVIDNELTESALNNGETRGVELVIHGIVSDILIHNNYIHNEPGVTGGGGYGIGVDAGYNSAESFTNVTITCNVIKESGRRSIECNAWIGGLIENNTIEYNGSMNHTGIRFSQQRNTPGTPTTKDVTIRNNYITGSGIWKDIDTSVGTNFTVEKTDKPVEGCDEPVDPPDTEIPPVDPPDPEIPPVDPPACDVEIKTRTQIIVNGVITKTCESSIKG